MKHLRLNLFFLLVTISSFAQSVVNKTILFATNEYRLSKGNAQELGLFINSPGIKSIQKIKISGYTDNIGSENHNFNLSAKRAQSVRDFIAPLIGIITKIEISHFGADSPIASNSNKEGRLQNRRVEVSIEYLEPENSIPLKEIILQPVFFDQPSQKFDAEANI